MSKGTKGLAAVCHVPSQSFYLSQHQEVAFKGEQPKQ